MNDTDRRQHTKLDIWGDVECEGYISDLLPGAFYHESAVRELVGALADYGAHESGCIAGQWRQGRPIEGGGYETLFGHGKQEKWYPRDESPPCTCGLSELIAHYKELIDES